MIQSEHTYTVLWIHMRGEADCVIVFHLLLWLHTECIFSQCQINVQIQAKSI